MTKQELLDNYTMEQLADMVIRFKNIIGEKCREIHSLKKNIEKLEKSNEELQVKLDAYERLMNRCTNEAREMIEKGLFLCVRIVSIKERENSENADKISTNIECELKEIKKNTQRLYGNIVIAYPKKNTKN